jgi:hypothetical protein
MRTRSILGVAVFSSSVVLAGLTGCGSSSDSGQGTGTDDVVTSKCPASLSYELDDPFVFKRTPTKRFDGTPLTAAEQTRAKETMDVARNQGPTKTTLGNLVKRSGTCSYSSGETKAVLRTKDGKDRLDISFGDFRVFAFPESFDKNGVVFGPRAVVNYFAAVGAAGNIRIGKVRVSTPTGRASGETTIRVPVIDESGALLNDTDKSFPRTIVLDGSTGPDKYSELTDKIEAKGIEPMRFASPNDYETKDPATSICFTGDERDVCGFLGLFTDNLLGDMFGIAGDEERGDACRVTKNSVSFDFFMSESDSTDSATIPRCK